MKLHAICATIAAAVLSLHTARAEEKPETELGKQMEAANDALKAMKKETDPAKGAALARQAEAALVKCLSEVPSTLEKTPEAEKAKALANYRTLIAKSYVTVSQIEEAYLANDLEKVKTLSEALRPDKKEGHEKYKPKDEH
ncbi:MAG: cytochrome b562 [Luteolibacter sp.]